MNSPNTTRILAISIYLQMHLATVLVLRMVLIPYVQSLNHFSERQIGKLFGDVR